MHRLLALAFVVLLAGCMSNTPDKAPNQEPEDESPTSSATPTNQPTLPTEPVDNTTAAPPTLNLDGCTGWDAFWDFLPSAQVPTSNTPPGWERTDPAPTTGAGVLVLTCTKLGLGPLERGPVTLMIDRHWNVDVPAPCRQDTQGGTSYAVLAKLYVDDPDVAAYLTATYGMPTGSLELQVASSATGPVTTHEVKWSADAGPESTLTLVQDGTKVTRDLLYRSYWTHGERLVRWQLDLSMEGPDFANRPGHGTIQDPMLMAQVNSEFAGLADWFTAITGPSSFLSYDDYLCEAPSA